jgi:ABC-type multidrug transport system fused ATPase/permease subunit
MDAISELAGKKTIVLVAHRLATLRDCDIIYMLERGRVVAEGSYQALLVSSPVFRSMAGVATGRISSSTTPALDG